MSRDGAVPRLPDDDAEGHDSLRMPDLPSIGGEHGQIVAWIHRALIVVQQDLQKLERRLSHMEGGEEERAAWRKSVDEKLNAIAASVGDAGVTGWRSLLTQRNLPLTMMGVLVVFLCAVLWGVIFGPADMERKIDHIRGTHAAEAPARE